jgi:hypothetical protein
MLGAMLDARLSDEEKYHLRLRFNLARSMTTAVDYYRFGQTIELHALDMLQLVLDPTPFYRRSDEAVEEAGEWAYLLAHAIDPKLRGAE